MSSEAAPTRGVAILGSTGSIGTQALDVIREQRDRLHVEVLTAHRNADLLIKQALEFEPNTVVIGDTDRLGEVKDALSMVILAPMSQLGCFSACAFVTLRSSSRLFPRNGPPEAVRMTFSMGLRTSPARHW